MNEDEEKVWNKTHPELQEGEMYLCTLFREEDYQAIQHTSKRKGINAYSFLGGPMAGCFPVFVQEEEEQRLAPIRKQKLDGKI